MKWKNEELLKKLDASLSVGAPITTMLLIWVEPAGTKLASLFCECSSIDLNKNILLTHIVFIFIATFAIFWLAIAMFAQDFQFDLEELSKPDQEPTREVY